MKLLLPEKYWHKFFEIGIFVKGFNGVWETVSGILVLSISKLTLSHWLSVLAEEELLEDPNDPFIHFVTHSLENFSHNTQIFAALYILGHGILNIFLAVQLYKEKKWAYKVAAIAMLVFMIYQVYRISIHHSLILTAITIFDVFFVIITWHEYRYHSGRHELK